MTASDIPAVRTDIGLLALLQENGDTLLDEGRMVARELQLYRFALAEMQTVVPWKELCAVIEPYYPQATSAGGRPAAGLERMLRIHCLQLWFNLSDPAVEEALYDSRAMRATVGGCRP